MANAPTFATTPNVGMVQITGVTTTFDGTGANVVTGFTAGPNGSRVDRITVTAAGTTVAGNIGVFISDGTVTRMYRQILVTAGTTSATVQAWVGQLAVSLILPTGYSLKFTTTAISGTIPFNVLVEGANF